MDVFTKINDLSILEVLDYFWIGYTKNWAWYVLRSRDWKKDISFSVDINKNMVTDFGKTWIQGWVFDFIWQYELDYSKEEMKTNLARANTVKLFIEKWLVEAPKQKDFKPSLKNDELLAKFDEFKLNWYKAEISGFLMNRWVTYEYIQKNSNEIWSVFKDIWYYDSYYTTEFESSQDEHWNWIINDTDKARTVWVFMFPCYDSYWALIWVKLRRKDWKTIRGKKSLAIWKTGLIYDKIDNNEMIIVEWEMDYIILKIMWYNNIIWNLGWVRSGLKMFKELLFETTSVICLYDKDPAWIAWMESLQKFLNKSIFKVEFPIREDHNGFKISDVNDLYKCWYDTKKKWDKVLALAEPVTDSKDIASRYRFVFIDDWLSLYDTRWKRFESPEKVWKLMGLTWKELFKLISDKKIPTFDWLCYRDWGKDKHYNTLDKDTITDYNWEAKATLHPHIAKLIDNVCWHKQKNIKWLHRSILYKLTHLNDVNLPAVILYGIWASWKWSFINLLSKIFWKENTLNNLKQRDLESSFDSYQWEKLIVEFQEIISWNTMQDKKTLDRIKSMVWEKTLTINVKNQNIRTVDNIARFHFSSNHPVPIQLDSKDSWNRRFTIIKTSWKLPQNLAVELNEITLKNKIVIQEYIAWLYETYPDVPDLTIFPALDNDEKRNLEENCESQSNTFFNWLEISYPYITRISVKQKNMLLTKYCSETGQSEFDISFKQKNFDLWLSHRFEKKKVVVNKLNAHWYMIHKTKEQLEQINNLEESVRYVNDFKKGELENISGVTF